MANYTSKKQAEGALRKARQKLVKTADDLRKASKAVKDAKTIEERDKAKALEDKLQKDKKKAIAECANIQLVIDRFPK